jgi:superfamily I DNA/RNA helicase
MIDVAGSGKTTLTTSTIDIIRKEHPNYILLYFFYNRKTNDEHKSSSIVVIRSLLFQLWLSTKDDEQLRGCWKEVVNSVDLERT